MILWMTGLSCAGKTTLATELKIIDPKWIILDGDILRKDLCSDLGYSDNDRKENMRRLIALCKILNENNLNVITTFISPFEHFRNRAKNEIKDCYIIYCKSSLAVCEKRDIKGLYKKARKGEIKNFTGIDSIYEEPKNPDLILDTENKDIYECVNQILDFIGEII